MKCRDTVYLKMKQTPVNTQQYITLNINLKTYNGILRRNNLLVAKTMHCHTTFGKCKHDIKDTRNTIKTIIQKTTTDGKLPDAVVVGRTIGIICDSVSVSD